MSASLDQAVLAVAHLTSTVDHLPSVPPPAQGTAVRMARQEAARAELALAALRRPSVRLGPLGRSLLTDLEQTFRRAGQALETAARAVPAHESR